jgi:hypothetical protein
MVADSCLKRRKDGGLCQARPTTSGFCPSHDPALSGKIREARARGGRGKSTRARAARLLPADLQLLDRVIDRAIDDLYSGSISPGQGSALSALVGSKIRLREVSLKLAEQSELRSRISHLEEKIVEFGLKNHTNGKATRRGW